MDAEFDIAAWVRQARAHWGQSQEALGDLLGKTKGNVSAWENGRHEPSFKQVLQISAITGYPLPAEIKVKTATETAANDAVQVDPDGLLEVIYGYTYGTHSERIALLEISRRVRKRINDANGGSSAG